MAAALSSLNPWISAAQQIFMRSSHKISKWKEDPNIVHRVIKIACAILKIMDFYPPAKTLLFVFSTVDLQDVFMVSKIPQSLKNLIKPVTQDSIDIEQQKKEFKEVLETKLKRDIREDEINTYFTKLFVDENNKSITFTESKFRNVLSDKMKTFCYDENSNDFEDLAKDMPIHYRSTTLEGFNDWMWTAVSISCMTYFLQTCNFIDTAKWSETIGQFSVFQCIKNRNLEEGIVGLVAASYFVKFIASGIRHNKLEGISEKNAKKSDSQNAVESIKIQQHNAGCDLASSLFETTLNIAVLASMLGFISIGGVYLQTFVIVTKFMGIVCIIQKDKTVEPMSLV